MAAGQTIRHRPDLTGAPINIQRELEYLRTAIYALLDNDAAMLARIVALEKAKKVADTPAPAAPTPQGPQPSGPDIISPPTPLPGCAVVVTFQGRLVCLSPFPLLDNPISGPYMLALFNFLNSVPGAFEYGCIQSSGIYTWPQVDDLPPPPLPIPPDWGPYLIVGNKVIHPSTVCDR